MWCVCVCVNYRWKMEGYYNKLLALGSIISGWVMGYFHFYFVHLTLVFKMFALTVY